MSLTTGATTRSNDGCRAPVAGVGARWLCFDRGGLCLHELLGHVQRILDARDAVRIAIVWDPLAAAPTLDSFVYPNHLLLFRRYDLSRDALHVPSRSPSDFVLAPCLGSGRWKASASSGPSPARPPCPRKGPKASKLAPEGHLSVSRRPRPMRRTQPNKRRCAHGTARTRDLSCCSGTSPRALAHAADEPRVTDGVGLSWESAGLAP